MEDKNTVAYFDKYTPEYSVERFNYVIDFINKQFKGNCSLIDIGCGTGNILELIKNKTKLKNLYGIDISRNCLLKTKERVNCKVFLGSILDNIFVNKLPRFDFAILGAVLHHLIGRTRKESRMYVQLAILNSLRLLKKGGYLIIVESTFDSSFLMDLIFYIKKIVTKLTNKRISIFGKWNNIGAPVVSYYTYEQIIKMINRIGDNFIIKKEIKKQKINFLFRLITKGIDVIIVIKKLK